MWAFILVLILITSIINASGGDTGEIQALNFLLVGDWGKGGNTGYLASRISDNNDINDDESNIKHHALEQQYGQNNSIKDGRIRVQKNQQATNQAAIAKAMGSYSDDFEPSFIIALGDNFYANGVSSSTDSYWDYLWVNVYLDYYPSLRVAWYPVFGNHDYGYGDQGVQAQLDRTLIDEYWSFPATNYTKTFNIPQGGTVTVVFIDTTVLAPTENKCCNENGGISSEVQLERITDQLAHIEDMLVEAHQKKSTWLLVAGHYPVYSMGEHGDTDELKDYLVPLLEKYRVNAYFNGHDHFSEHLTVNDVNYFVNGGGCMTDTVMATSDAELIWAGEGYSAFASASATKTDLTISYIDADTATKYSYTLTNPLYPWNLSGRSTSKISKKYISFLVGITVLSVILLGAFIKNSKGSKNRTRNQMNSSLVKPMRRKIPKTKKKPFKLLRSSRKFKIIPDNISPAPFDMIQETFVSNDSLNNTMDSNREPLTDTIPMHHKISTKILRRSISSFF